MTLFLSFVVSLALVWLLDYFQTHSQLPRPTGGMAISAVVVLPLFFLSQHSTIILLSISLAFALGLLDDMFDFGPWSKLIVEFAIALAVVRAGYRLGWFSLRLDVVVSLMWIVGMMNAVNLMDNMDGLAAGLAVIAGAFFYTLTRDPLALVMCGALLGFLLFNYRPASVYMGDSGSLMIGLILAVLPMIHRNQVAPYSALLILSVPLLDMTRLCFDRPLRRKRPPWKGGRDHISHILAKKLGERRAVIALYAASTIFGFVGVYA